MSIANLEPQSIIGGEGGVAPVDIKIRDLTVDETINTNTNGTSFPFSWNPGVGGAVVTTSGPSFIIATSLNTTQLTAGAVAAAFTINNPSIKATSIVHCTITDYSDFPLVYDAVTFYGTPIAFPRSITNGSMLMTIINDGFNNMSVNATYKLVISLL